MIRKKPLRDIHLAELTEPVLSPAEWHEYERGWTLFNERRFWEAHEAWEAVWRNRSEDSRIFFQGIIQLAAAYHLLVVKKRFGGMMRNLDKAEEKLKLFPRTFLRVDVGSLLETIEHTRAEAQRLSEHRLELFNASVLPSVSLHPRPHHT